MKARSRGAPREAAQNSISTDLRALATILLELQAGSDTSPVLQSVFDKLASGAQVTGYESEYAARQLFKRVTAAQPSDRENRRYHKMLCLLMDNDLPQLNDLLPEWRIEKPVHHRTPMGVVPGRPALAANKMPMGLASCDMRGLSAQTISDFLSPVTAYYEAGGDRDPDEYFCDILSQNMTVFEEKCQRLVGTWLNSSVISPTEEELFSILTLILLHGTNYSVVMNSKLVWNSKTDSYELRSRKPRSGYIPIRLALGGGVLSDALVKLRKIRSGNAGSPGLLSIWNGCEWRDISATRYTIWLNSVFPSQTSARLLPCQFRTTLAQVIALSAGQGIERASKRLNHQSLRQTIEYVDSPYFRSRQDRAAIVVLDKISAMAVSALCNTTLAKLGLEAEVVKHSLQAVAKSVGFPMPTSSCDPLLSVSVVPPSPLCDRRKSAEDGMPLATAGDTAALVGRAAHFLAHNMSMIIEAAHHPRRDEHSEISLWVLTPGSAGDLHKVIKLNDAMGLLSASIQIILSFSGFKPVEQAEVLKATPFFKAGAWRLELGGGHYVKPVSAIAAAVIKSFTQCLNAVAAPLRQEKFRLPEVSSRMISDLLEVYGLPAYWHLEIGHAKKRPLFTPARLFHGFAYLWWIAAERDLSAFAYQTGDHSFSRIKRLLPRIERASIADPIGFYAQKIVPAIALIMNGTSRQPAANENQLPPIRAEVRRKRLPIHEYGADRGSQLDLRIALLDQIATGSLNKINLPCDTIQDVLGWDCEADGVIRLKTKSLRARFKSISMS